MTTNRLAKQERDEKHERDEKQERGQRHLMCSKDKEMHAEISWCMYAHGCAPQQASGKEREKNKRGRTKNAHAAACTCCREGSSAR
jgi:hypothetical protein